jgi:hypothetical protein
MYWFEKANRANALWRNEASEMEFSLVPYGLVQAPAETTLDGTGKTICIL